MYRIRGTVWRKEGCRVKGYFLTDSFRGGTAGGGGGAGGGLGLTGAGEVFEELEESTVT